MICEPMNGVNGTRRNIVFHGDKASFRRFLIKMQVADTTSNPKTKRKDTFKSIADSVVSGVNMNFYVWSNKLPKETVIRESFLNSDLDFKSFIEASGEGLLNYFDSTNDAIDWVDNINIPNRTPTGMDKITHTQMKRAKEHVNEYMSAKSSRIPNYEEMNFKKTLIKLVFEHIRDSKEEIENFYSKSKAKPNTLKLKFATYIKEDSTAYTSFIQNVESLENFFKSLKKPWTIPLEDNLIVKFVNKKVLPSIAKYKTT